MTLEKILEEIKEEVEEEMSIMNGVPIEIIAFDKCRDLEELHRINDIYYMGRTHQKYQDLKCKLILNQMEIYYSYLQERSGNKRVN